MKKILFVCFSSIIVIITGCDTTIETDTRHYHIRFTNTSNYDTYIRCGLKHPDTSLATMQEVTVPAWHLKTEAHSTNYDALTYRTTYESIFRTHDTLMVFVFNADTVESYDWEQVQNNYMIAQRYDLALNDLYQLNWQLTFPPSKEMRNIKMWPPYGTYDANGYRIE